MRGNRWRQRNAVLTAMFKFSATSCSVMSVAQRGNLVEPLTAHMQAGQWCTTQSTERLAAVAALYTVGGRGPYHFLPPARPRNVGTSHTGQSTLDNRYRAGRNSNAISFGRQFTCAAPASSFSRLPSYRPHLTCFSFSLLTSVPRPPHTSMGGSVAQYVSLSYVFTK